jgi:beta-glucanase (GH16 family)
MKRLFSTILIVMSCLSGIGLYAQSWQLVWQDEFTNGIGPDWVFETGTGSGGWGNNELQYYRQENASVVNGQLVITAKREAFGGMQYTSARMKTQGRKSWKYGKIEARIAMPSFQGVWPAFWMLGTNITSVGWPACGEIDIMEHVNTGGTVHGTIHWQDHNNNYANYGGNTSTTITNFHLYTVEWDANLIKWFVDGVKYHEVNIANGVNGTSEFHNNFFILLNMAIGGNWPGFTIDNNAFPARMYVDYVRVYQNVPTFTQTIQAESYSAMSGVQTETTTDAGGGLNVGWIDTNDWMAYNSINIPATGQYRLEYRVASPSGGRLSQDLNGGSIVLGAVNIPATGGWQNWTTVSQTVTINAGTYNFGIFAAAGGWNLNWWRITRVTSGASEAEATVVAVPNPESREFTFYPNPTRGELNIRSGDSDSVIKIVNSNGAEVYNGKVVDGKVDVSNLPNGIYTISTTENGRRTIKRFIKK